MNNIISCIKALQAICKVTFKDLKYNVRHYEMRSIENEEINFAKLRMYCHMLDKGLNNPYFEKGHSKDVYINAKGLYNKLLPAYVNDRSFKWCGEIIDCYELAQKNGSPSLSFTQSPKYSDDDIRKYSTFIFSRVSVRNFMQKEISEETIRRIMELAVDAPNGCCRQSTRFYLTQDKAKIKTIIPCVAGITNFTNIQCLVAVCAESSFYGLIDKNLQYVDASLAAENLILASRIFNLYGTMCNFFHASENEVSVVKQTLGINVSENVVLVIAMGYPTMIPRKPVRRDVELFYKLV